MSLNKGDGFKRILGRDQIAGILLIGVAVIYYRLADALPRSLISDRVGAEGFPKLLAVALIAFSVILILQGFFRGLPLSAQQADEGSDHPWSKFMYAAGMLCLGVGYLLIVSWAGYMASIALLLLAALRYQREPMSWKMLLVAVLGGLLFWAFFVHALKTPMPSGIWPNLLSGK